MSTSSSVSSVLLTVADFDGLNDDANDDIELLELLVLGCGPNASTTCNEKCKEIIQIYSKNKVKQNCISFTDDVPTDNGFMKIISPCLSL